MSFVSQLEWLSWLELYPMHQKVDGLIPGQGAHQGYGFDPCMQSECIQKATDQCFPLTSPSPPFLLSLIPSPLLSLSMSSDED